MDEMLFVFENTGIYSSLLSLVLSENDFDYAQVPALEIKRSLGITRGKSDKVDAREIAVSYTHLDVYKRQSVNSSKSFWSIRFKYFVHCRIFLVCCKS